VEGGGVTLYGMPTNDGWRYECEYADQTPLFLDEKPIEPPPLSADTWEGALELLDNYRCFHLPAVMVHPDFRERLLAAFEERLASGARVHPYVVERWRERCN
jgi:hypothetical protein